MLILLPVLRRLLQRLSQIVSGPHKPGLIYLHLCLTELICGHAHKGEPSTMQIASTTAG